MLELPEALTIAAQINDTIRGRKIDNVIAGYSPHKFAWYNGDPKGYPGLLTGNTIGNATQFGGMVLIRIGAASMLISDGVNLRYHEQAKDIPLKHQLLLELDDYSKVSASVQMYGGIMCFNDESEFQYSYYLVSKEKPSPLSDAFDAAYFEKLLSEQEVKKLSVKAFLATEQRIPGLGNGVLQDILWEASINPKRKVAMLKDEDMDRLFKSIKSVLHEMTELRGRDTERDLFGNNGGYITRMSKNSVGSPCTKCGSLVVKGNYLGGSIYYCEKCQPIA